MRHISNNSNIMIQVDSDMDGYTSGAILINYLYKMFPTYTREHVSYRLHGGKQHGIIVDTIPENIKLLICPDSGTNDFEQHEILKQRGTEVLVLDHHDIEDKSKYACIINNQDGHYPNPTLSGAGVTYKFCSYIDSLAGTNHAERLMDLATLGLVADMVETTHPETRYIITEGIFNINNLFLKQIIKDNEFSLRNDGLNPHTIAFTIAPYINATVRLGDDQEKTLIFEAFLDYKAEEKIPSTKRGEKGQFETRAEQASRTAKNIRSRQNKARDENMLQLKSIIEERKLDENKIVAIKMDDICVNKNLTGLIANQIMAKYQKPVLILNRVEKEDGIYWEGSGRGPSKTKLESFKDFLQQSNLVPFVQGHPNAFGVSVPEQNFSQLVQYANEQLANIDFNTTYKVDFIYQANDFRPNDILEIAELKSVYAQGVEEPYIAIENIRLTENNIVLFSPDKSPTLRINLSNGTSLIKFKSSSEEFNLLYPKDNKTIIINVVGTCAVNEWNGIISPQIKIVDYEIKRTVYDF